MATIASRLATVDITSTNTWTQIYQVPNGKATTCSVSICNRNGSSNASIRVAITNSTTPANSEMIEYNHDLYQNEAYQRGGIVLGSGQYLYVYSSTANISVNVWGFEE